MNRSPAGESARFLLVLAACDPPSPPVPAHPRSITPSDAGTTHVATDAPLAIDPCRERRLFDLGPNAPAGQRYQIFLCGSYPIKNINPWRIRVGAQESGGAPMGDMLRGSFALPFAPGDPVCIVVYGTEVCDAPITAEEPAR